MNFDRICVFRYAVYRRARVGAGVRLVESVAGELFLIRRLRTASFRILFLFRKNPPELGTLRGHFLFFLFAHGAS